jgi:RNA polymerase sigma-70 factor (ECF subfamily)
VERRSDLELWDAAARDPHAFGELYERHVRAVYAFCARRTGDLAHADDLVSVVFLEAWRRRGDIVLTGDSALPWLLGIANNVARNARRSLRRYRSALRRVPHAEAVDLGEDDIAARIDAQRALTEAIEALRALSESEREVVNLVLWAGLSYGEAASVLRVPIGTVRSRLSRARSKLAQSMDEENPLPGDAQ